MAQLSLTADRPVNRNIAAWFALVHLFGFAGLVYLVAFPVPWQTGVFAVVWFYFCHLAISAGMHRLYSHQSYRASRPLQLFLLFFAAGVVQGSALWWVSVHRRHHKYADQEEDPHNINRGFWWAHMEWNMRQPLMIDRRGVKDLFKNPLVIWQQRNYRWLSYTVGVILPAVICFVGWGDWVGGLLVAAGLRLVVQYHTTWSINSVAHSIGWKHSTLGGTARDNWWLAPFTVGEAYHESHHVREQDYRLGRRWYDFDPGKWFIWSCAQIGLASDLKRFELPHAATT